MPEQLTVADVRKAIEGLPDDAPVRTFFTNDDGPRGLQATVFSFNTPPKIFDALGPSLWVGVDVDLPREDSEDDDEPEFVHDRRGCVCASCGAFIENAHDGESTPSGEMHIDCAAAHKAAHPEQW